MGFFGRTRRQPYSQADGKVSRQPPKTVFSFVRLAVLVVLFGWLAAANTENRALRTWMRTAESSRLDESSFESRRTTNYGLFHVKERILKVVVNVAGHEWSCHYDEPIYGEILCRDTLRNNLCHEMPLFEGDIVYRLHRWMCYLLIVSTCLAACVVTPIHLAANQSLLSNSILSLFLSDQLRQAPGPILIHRLLSWNVFCYPALRAMYKTIEYQDERSFFLLYPDDPEMNFSVSICIIFVMAILLNALSTFWDSTFVLQFEAISAILMGFHAKYRAAMVMEVFYLDISWNAITWSFIGTLVLQRSFTTAGFWWLAHLAGQTLGQYQMDHYISTLTMKRVIDWLNW